MRLLQSAAILLLAGTCEGHAIEHTISVEPARCNGFPCGDPLQWAQAAARKLTSQSSNQTVIRMSPGTYALTSPLELGAADSSVHWVGPANVSGFVEVTNWTLNVSTGVWTAPLPAPFSSTRLPTQLFVNGDRRVRARMPAVVGGDARNVSAAYSAASSFDLQPMEPCAGEVCPPVDFTGFVYNASDSRLDVSRLRPGGDVVMFHRWSACRAPIAAVFPHNTTVLLGVHCTYAAGSPLGGIGRGKSRWIAEGDPVLVGTPGEWAANGSSMTVSYTPLPGEVPGSNTTLIQLPALSTLLNVSGGDAFSPVQNLHFQDITFQGAADDGSIIGERFAVHGAVEVTFATNVSFAGCQLRGIGGNGLQLGPGVVGLSFDQGVVSDVGGHGLYIAGDLGSSPSGGNNATNVSLTNNRVSDVGLIYFSQPTGILVNGLGGILVAHNDIERSTYAGVQLVWFHGGPPPPESAPPLYNISFNRVADYGMGVLSDFGGIRVAVDGRDNCWNSTDPARMCWVRALVDSNYISGGRHASYGADGFYTDQATAGVTVVRNIIANVGAGALHQHCGLNMTYTNNILFGAAQQQEVGETSPWPLYGAIYGCGWNDYSPPAGISMSFSRNIVVVTAGGVATQHENVTSLGFSSFDNNVYFAQAAPLSSAVLLFPLNATWDEWKAAGNDPQSVNADPLLADPDGGNFTVLPGSPAWAMGWQAIDSEAIGPQV